MSNSGLMTIDRFNKLTGHETLHPLICMVDLSRTNLNEDIRMMCDFYGLLYYNDPEQDKISGKEWLRLIYPGETVEIEPTSTYRMLFGRVVSSRFVMRHIARKPYRNLSETLLL